MKYIFSFELWIDSFVTGVYGEQHVLNAKAEASFLMAVGVYLDRQNRLCFRMSDLAACSPIPASTGRWYSIQIQQFQQDGQVLFLV